MRLIFMGSPDFAVPVLEALLDAGHEVICVYSQPPRAAGRGHRQRLSAVHACAAAAGLSVRTPQSLKDKEQQRIFGELAADIAVVAAYGLMLPDVILKAPAMGCINVHASLLPRWRGAAPIQRAIMAGDTKTGISIMQVEEALDTGPVLLIEEIQITADTTSGQLHDALCKMAARMTITALERLQKGDLTPMAQASEGVSYAAKLQRNEGRIDWHKPAMELERAIRALNPWPGVWFEHAGERIKVLAASVSENGGNPGTVVDEHLTVSCGVGALTLKKLQRAGKTPSASDDFLRGYPLPVGSKLF